jgi:HEAT repeat protein
MGKRMRYVLLLCVAPFCMVAWYGCGKRQKSTAELVADLKSGQEKDRIIAARLLPLHKREAAQAVPVLMEALKDPESDIRWSAAIGLGNLGEAAKEAIPDLQAALKDRDARVREAAGVALSRIDPTQFTAPSKQARRGK